MIVVLALVLSAASDEPSAAGRSAETLTLERAVALALAGNPSVQEASLQVQRTDEQIGAARTRYLPSLQGQASAGKLLTPVEFDFRKGALGELPGVGPVPAQDTTVKTEDKVTAIVSATITQPLSQLYKVGLGVHSAELAKDIDLERLQAQRLAVVAEVRKLYYGILQTQSALQSAEEQVTAYRELDRLTTQYVAREAALPSDELDAKAGLASAELQVLSLRNGLVTQKEQMNVLLGRDLRTEFAVAAVPEATAEELDLEAARSRALRDRPDLKQARLSVEHADTERRLKSAEYIPDLSIAFQYYSFFNVDILPRNIAQVGLSLTWEPWDWGRRSREVSQRRLAAEQAKLEARNAENSALVEVGDRFRKLQEARAQVEASRLALESARTKAPVALHRYRAQAGLLKDVLQAQAHLADASRSYQQALLSLWATKAEFQRALGEGL